MNVNKKYILAIISAALCGISAFNACAGGVALGTTRIIYLQGDKQTTLPVTNSDKQTVFLVQSWVADEKGNKSKDFVVTPPLFSMQPQRENALRIMYVGGDLPVDRETVYYFNAKAIPATKKSEANQSSLQIATQSVIKLFVRPKALPTQSSDAPKTLSCQYASGKVTVQNPSPYYVTLAHFQVGNKTLDNTMVSPKGSQTIDLPADTKGSEIKFQTINDYGSLTAEQICR